MDDLEVPLGMEFYGWGSIRMAFTRGGVLLWTGEFY